MAELLDILKSGEIEVIKLLPSTNVEGEGTLHYDAISKNFIVENDIPDVNLNLGEETVMRVKNNTGSTLFNGKAVRYGGLCATCGLPEMVLSIADTFNNSRVLGIVTHDILDGEEGFITSIGTVNGIDTSMYTEGMIIFVSDKFPGDFTHNPPDIASVVGAILVSDNQNGRIAVSITNTLNLPSTLAFMSGQDNSLYNLNSTVQVIKDYTNKGSLVLTPDKTLGSINTKFPGFYEIGFVMSGESSEDKAVINWEFYNTTTQTTIFAYSHSFNKGLDNNKISTSFSILTEVLGSGESISVRASASKPLELLFSDISFSIKSVHIR